MDGRKYFFLAGLPRSGTTLLSSLLNQNPEIGVSANSFLADHFYNTAMLNFDERLVNFPDNNSLNDLISSTFDSYYKSWPQKYIIDKGPWGTPSNLGLLKVYLQNEIKIVVTVRDIVELIASWIHLDADRLREELDKDIQNNRRFNESYKSDIELLCEIVTRPDGQLEQYLFSLHNLLKEENRQYLHLVEYKDLVQSPERTLRGVYKFLGIDSHNHEYKFIKPFTVNGVKYKDDTLYSKGLHDVRPKLKFPNYKVKDVLPDYLIKRYSGREFWR
tara:strand:- start:105 stop:926 length:822 start_codon:yes stop_codon:yes gene_type:complete